MTTRPLSRSLVMVLLLAGWVALLAAGAALTACGGPSPEELAAVDYTPLPDGDWPLATPEEVAVDPTLVAALYHQAATLETLESLLVLKDGQLIAEDYFNGGAPNRKGNLQSVTKSFVSALMGLAIEQGCVAGVDEPMLTYFPELAGRAQRSDPRKADITIRDLLQMRAGYPWEESTEELFDLLYRGFRTSTIVEVPLVRDPGSDMEYSNLSAHILGIIVARACDTDLRDYAQTVLLDPLGVNAGPWGWAWENYRLGSGGLELSPRDLVKFGQMILDGGVYDGGRILPEAWVADSLRTYSNDAWPYRVGRNFNDIGYGYQWWSVRAGEHPYHLAWGHGGQQIALIPDQNMVVVATADPLFAQHGDKPWRWEKANLNLVADFIASLPSE